MQLVWNFMSTQKSAHEFKASLFIITKPDKLIMVYLYNGILFNNKNKWTTKSWKHREEF